MTRLQRHIFIPAIAPLLFFVVALSPVDWLGCRNRGLVALGIAIVSAFCGLACAGMGLRCTLGNSADGPNWAISTLIFVLPPLGLLLLA